MKDVLDVQQRLVTTLREPRTAPPSKAAAVAAVLRDSPTGVEVLFIRRAERQGDPWSGHMGFPGGRAEESDASLLHTATRETDEEIRLALAPDSCIGRLPDLEAIGSRGPTGLVIRPFVFAIVGNPDLVFNHEVDAAYWSNLGSIRSGRLDSELSFRREGQLLTFPAYDVAGQKVWGLTYRMLQMLFESLDADRALGED